MVMFNREFDEKYHENVSQLIEHYERMIKDNSNFFFEESSLEQIIEFYEEKNDYKKALESADFAITQYPYSSVFLTKKAQILFDLKKFEDALDLLDKAEVFDPNDLNINLLRSDIHVWQGNFDKAVSVIKLSIKNADEEDLPDLYLELADIYEEWEKYDKVFESLTQTLKVKPDNEEALNRLWFCVEFTEKYEESIKFHEWLIDESPYAYLAWFNLAHAYAGLELYEKSIEAFEYVLAINDQYEYAYKDCAEIFYKLEQYPKAAEYFQKAATLSKPYKEIFFSIGQCYEKMNNHNRARYYFRKATSLDPYYSEAFYKIGLNYQYENRWSNALSSFERAYKLEGENCDYTLALARAYRESELYDKAVQYFQKVVKLKPEVKEYWVELSKTLFEASEYREAISTLDTATESFGDNADLHFMKSAYYYQIGNRNESFLNLEQGLIKDYRRHNLIFQVTPYMQSDVSVLNIIDQYAV